MRAALAEGVAAGKRTLGNILKCEYARLDVSPLPPAGPAGGSSAS